MSDSKKNKKPKNQEETNKNENQNEEFIISIGIDDDGQDGYKVTINPDSEKEAKFDNQEPSSKKATSKPKKAKKSSVKTSEPDQEAKKDKPSDEDKKIKIEIIASKKDDKKSKKSNTPKLLPSSLFFDLSKEEMIDIAKDCMHYFKLFIETGFLKAKDASKIKRWEASLKKPTLGDAAFVTILKEVCYFLITAGCSFQYSDVEDAKDDPQLLLCLIEEEIIALVEDFAESNPKYQKVLEDLLINALSAMEDVEEQGASAEPNKSNDVEEPSIINELKQSLSFPQQVKQRLEANPYPDNIKKAILEELNNSPASALSSDSAVKKEHINFLLDLPYWQVQEEEKDLKKIINSLNKSHYGMNKVKERVVEYLAVRLNSTNSREPVICLVGPPGVGKTSLVYSIAKALNKKFAKISFAGVRDEAEIRGHRKTYVGAMPGRIMKAIKQSGVTNPLILLDEIDKIGSDSGKGDPASALLEVLDPSQNNQFNDNYVEEYYDLSKVLFIATANYLDQIPEALRDRIEIIDLNSYTIDEKYHIASTHLIPSIIKEYNVSPKALAWDEDIIKYIINHYTYEAGVRELDRLIRKIYRKYLVNKSSNIPTPKKVSEELVTKFLGKIIFDYTKKDTNPINGVVNGMAYTSAGGDLLPIECNVFPGTGEIKITGNLEETMEESVYVALGYVKANAEKFGVNNFDFKNNDIHIHVPDGGVPKDGPSAGVALTTAIISKLSERKVPTNVSMTGEITLRGKVGRIGGVREKVISAHRGGVRKIFLPVENERDLDEVPKDIKKEIEFCFATTYDQIYKNLFSINNEKIANKIKGGLRTTQQ